MIDYVTAQERMNDDCKMKPWQTALLCAVVLAEIYYCLVLIIDHVVIP